MNNLIGPFCLFLFLFPIFWEVGHRGSLGLKWAQEVAFLKRDPDLRASDLGHRDDKEKVKL